MKNENYIQISGWMINELNLKGNNLLIYAIIYSFSQAEDTSYTGSLQYLADWTQSTKKTVIESLKKLVEDGYILKEEQIINKIKFCKYKHNPQKSEWCKNYNGGGVKITPGGGVKITHNNTNIDNTNDIYIDQFKKFYDKYPKKASRKAAEKSFMKAIKEVSFENIMNGLDNYIKEIEITKKSKQYIKQPSTWLNQGCWDDDYRIWSDFSLLKSNDVPKGYGMKEGVLHKLHHYKGENFFVHEGSVYFEGGNECGNFPIEKIKALEKGLLDE